MMTLLTFRGHWAYLYDVLGKDTLFHKVFPSASWLINAADVEL